MTTPPTTPPTTPHTRLSKQARREQLLDAALGIVRARGADGLTLVTLAEAAGVSRPIAYDHFGTRAGLLLALYRRLDQRHRAAVAEALRTAAPTAGAIAHVMSTAYFACATDMPEFAAVSAALKGDPEMEAIQHEMLDGYTNVMAAALAPHSSLPAEALRLRCVGVLGAAEAIAAELNREGTTADDAVSALTDLIVGSITTDTNREEMHEGSCSDPIREGRAAAIRSTTSRWGSSGHVPAGK